MNSNLVKNRILYMTMEMDGVKGGLEKALTKKKCISLAR